ncbi:rhamnulokinase family protein [Paenibacillus sp. NEAU-GSW1]|uniref:rhamnulokinase n=1 Tax=Paenibacillus sp. NEAU-GSW1 TaxID=2682486 RepID=UPI0012E30DE8|nr:rhamnulokinase family protein [Paenibacillus sp. NEAU-GSW1]MUT67207.1 rhamnulokinase [Paenibacillus sp. NEAU-GSW1]
MLLSTVLAFDLGASSGRALIGKLLKREDGRRALQVEEIHRFSNHAIAAGGHLHWDILRLLYEMKKAIRKAFQEGCSPETFGVDTWGVDFGLLDANGELLGNPYHYRDPQTEGLIEEVCALIGKEALFQQGGLQFMPFNTVYQLYAMRKASSPKLDAARTLLLTPDLLVYFLTGRKVCEFTMATTTQLFHPEKQAWNTELLERLGIPSTMLLEPIHPGTRIGPLLPEVCEELDIPPIEAVAVATHDTESAIAAVPAAADKGAFAYLVCGTWSLLGTELDRPLLSPEAMALDFSNEGGAFGKYQLLKNIMGLWILQECKREWDEQGEAEGSSVSFVELAAMAEDAAPFRSFINPDDLRFYGPSDMVQKVRAYCLETGQPVPETKGEIARCILESLALTYRRVLEQIESLTGAAFGGLHMVGGGIQNRLLCRLTAGALGRPVWAGPVEASAIGNMLMQLVAQGHCADLAEARELSAAAFPVVAYEPDCSEADGWNEAYAAYKRLIGGQSEVSA